MINELYNNLNENQKEAVFQPINQSSLVLASAGSGKTLVLISRIVYLIQQGVNPRNIMAVTFTNKAAREMRERLDLYLPEHQSRAVTMGTFHKFCILMLKKHGNKIGIDTNFLIADPTDQSRIMKDVLKELGEDPSASDVRNEMSNLGALKSKMVGLPEVQEAMKDITQRVYTDREVSVYKDYQNGLRKLNMLDFDDILLEAKNLLEKSELVRKEYQERYTHITLDEFQDTNPVQYEIVRLLSAKSMPTKTIPNTVMTVGDDFQCWHEDSLVLVKNGPGAPIKVPVRALVEGDMVAVNGSVQHRPEVYSKVTKKSKLKYADTLKIKVGHRELIITKDHFFFTKKDRKAANELIASYEYRDDSIGVIMNDDKGVTLLSPHLPDQKVTMNSYSNALDYVKLISQRYLINEVEERYIYKGVSLLSKVKASDLKVGNLIPCLSGEVTTLNPIDSIKDVGTQCVYSIEVAEHGVMIANDILSHNCIYSFRGSDIGILLDFENDFQDAVTIKLEQNYRSTKKIVDTANELISNNINQKTKVSFTSNTDGEKIIYHNARNCYEEADFIASEIDSLIQIKGYEPKEIAILYRANVISSRLEKSLINFKIPYHIVKGTSFFGRAEIKDMIAYLRLMVNPNDSISLERIMNMAPGVGKTTIEKIKNHAAENHISLAQGLKTYTTTAKKTSESLFLLKEILKELYSFYLLSKPSVNKMLKRIFKLTKYVENLQASTKPDDEARLKNIKELVNIITRFEEEEDEPSIQSFLEDCVLAPSDDGDDDKDAVQLLTIHGAKGLQWKAVFIAGFNEEIIPNREAFAEEGGLEEERRLAYVAITRAEERLYITNASTRNMYGKDMYYEPSRFVDELVPEHLADLQPW